MAACSRAGLPQLVNAICNIYQRRLCREHSFSCVQVSQAQLVTKSDLQQRHAVLTSIGCVHQDKSMFCLPQTEQTLPCLCLQDKQHKRKAAAAVLPVRLGDEGMALESSFKDGLKHEVLRSLCQLVNSSELALEVCLTTCHIFRSVFFCQ